MLASHFAGHRHALAPRRLAPRRLGVAAGLVLAGIVSLPAMAQQIPYTPRPGTPERKAIADAMRAVGDIHDRVFVVRSLVVQNGWAWLVSVPQSPDGKNHYEPETALLHKEGTAWKVMDRPCAEETCDAKREVARIQAAFPAAPAGIFPK